MKPLEVLKIINHRSKRLQKLLDEHEQYRIKWRKHCEHEWKYESDPSGNNDSGYSCLCGAWDKNPYKKS